MLHFGSLIKLKLPSFSMTLVYRTINETFSQQNNYTYKVLILNQKSYIHRSKTDTLFLIESLQNSIITRIRHLPTSLKYP